MITRRKLLKHGSMLGIGALMSHWFDFSRLAIGAVPKTDPSILSDGIMVADFSGTKWQATENSPVLTRDYTGATGIRPRTDVNAILRWGPIKQQNEAIRLNTKDLPGGRPLSLNGRFGLWVYCDGQPGYSPGQSPASYLEVVLTTDPGGSINNAVVIGFNANQLREGWNFLKFVDNPVGHPIGVDKYYNGNGSAGKIINDPVYSIEIYAYSGNSGATWYLDSLWTGFKNIPQVVLGCDADGDDLVNYCLPIFQRYGWIGYVASNYTVWTSGPTQVTNWETSRPNLTAMAGAGWDIINHTVNHRSMGNLTDENEIKYEIQAQDTWLRSLGITKGLRLDLYASPQSSTSRLSERVIKESGIIAQRHWRKINTSLTKYGIDNPHHIGSTGMDDVTQGQTFQKIKSLIDINIAYEDTINLFWHTLVTKGDPGDGTGNTQYSASVFKSSWDMSIAYIRQLELANKLVITKGFSGFINGNMGGNLNKNAECLFNWAEANYPTLFAPSGAPTAVWGVYTYRYYSATNAYLGISSSDNHVYYKGADGILQDKGPLSNWLTTASCQ